MALHQLLPRPVRHAANQMLRALHLRDPQAMLDPGYPQWQARRMARRRELYTAPILGPRIDLLTLVHDTNPAHLRRAAASVAAQDYPSFRWLLFDNGSTRPATLAILAELQRLSWTTIVRSPTNVGITEGHRLALQECDGDYVALLDHDDELYPDALTTLAHHVKDHGQPALLYSDEDKLNEQGIAFCPFFKPAWSPALLLATPYTCHLSAFRRDVAEDLEFFSDPQVEGTQDWDVALRVHDSGMAAVHVPEVLYSWRVTPQSTARKIKAKRWALAAQRHALESSLQRRGLLSRFRVRPDPLYPYFDGHWHLESIEEELPRMHVHDGRVATRTLHDALRLFLETDSGDYFAHVPMEVHRLAGDWLRNAIGLLELHPQAGLVGGRVLDQQNLIVTGGGILGLGGLVGTPFAGRDGSDLGYFGFSLTPHNVGALVGVPWVARRAALADCSLVAAENPAVTELSLCLALGRQGWQLVYSPHLTAWTRQPRANPFSASEERTLRQELATTQARDPYYPPFCSLDPHRVYRTEACSAEHVATAEVAAPC